MGDGKNFLYGEKKNQFWEYANIYSLPRSFKAKKMEPMTTKINYIWCAKFLIENKPVIGHGICTERVPDEQHVMFWNSSAFLKLNSPLDKIKRQLTWDHERPWNYSSTAKKLWCRHSGIHQSHDPRETLINCRPYNLWKFAASISAFTWWIDQLSRFQRHRT